MMFFMQATVSLWSWWLWWIILETSFADATLVQTHWIIAF